MYEKAAGLEVLAPRKEYAGALVRMRGYLYAIGICALITWIASLLTSHLALANLVMLYLIGVVFTAARIGRDPGVLLSFLSVAAFDFFFVPPRFSFSVADTQYLLTFAGMLLTSLVISHLTSGLRREARIARSRERRTSAMYAMTAELGAALTREGIVEIGVRHVRDVFGAEVVVLLPGALERVVAQPGSTDIDEAIAQWVYDHQKPAGRGADVLPAAGSMLYLPLKAPMRTRGVLAFHSRDSGELSDPEQKRMLDTFAAQIALALERVHYVDIARDAVVSMESERLRNSLLSAISHDLRTPLTSIVGFASMLAGAKGDTHAPANAEVIEAIHEESLRMTGIVTNLLDMARLQSGAVRLNRQWTLLEETVGAALRACKRALGRHPVTVQLPAGLPLLRLDAVLMERLFCNILENAAKYTPPGAAILIGAETIEIDAKPFVRVHIDDSGPGLPPGMEHLVFDKFTRGEKEPSQPGMGLGLSLCKAIVEAHGGTIGALNKPRATVEGASFWFTLPVEFAPDMLNEAALPPATSGDMNLDFEP